MTDEWQLVIDWDRNNNFTDTYDDVTLDVREKVSWFLGCRPYQLVADESTLDFTLDNTSRRYSPENPSSPIYGQLVPNTPVRLLLGTTSMFTGTIKTIKVDPFLYGGRFAKFKCVGIKEHLSRQELFINLYQNVTADQVIEDIILGAASPPALSGVWRLGVPGFSELGVTTFLGSLSLLADLETGVTTFAYVGDNITSESTYVSAYELIKNLVEAERGRFFMDRRGRAVFWNQNHLPDDTSIEATFDNNLDGLDYATPIEELVNYAEVTCFPREASATSDILLWELSNSLTIKAGDSVVIHVPYRDADDKYVGATDLQTPTGADLAFSAGTAAVAVEASGQRAKITLTNSGVIDAVCTTLILRGKTLASKYPITKIAQDTTSIQLYGKYARKLSLKALDDPDTAQDVADMELASRSTVLGRASAITIESQPTDETDTAIVRTIGDMVRVIDDQTCHDRSYHIVGEKHALDINSKMLTTTWHLEPAPLRLAAYGHIYQDMGANLQGSDGKIAQSFTPGVDATVKSVRLWLKRTGSPTANLTVKIYADYEQPANVWKLGVVGRSELGTNTILGADVPMPSTTVITNGTSQTVSSYNLEAGYRWVQFVFATPPSVEASTKYWIVLETTASADGSNYVTWGGDGSSPTYAGGEMKSYLAKWTAENADACFEVYAASL